jgi:hypothetical protein
MEDRIICLMSDGDNILKEITVSIPQKKDFFEKNLNNNVESQIFGKFNIKKIICHPNTHFISHEYEGFDHFRRIIEYSDLKQRKVTKNDIIDFSITFKKNFILLPIDSN